MFDLYVALILKGYLSNIGLKRIPSFLDDSSFKPLGSLSKLIKTHEVASCQNLILEFCTVILSNPETTYNKIN